MILYKGVDIYAISSILHVCGDDPMRHSAELIAIAYSPRMWRWSLRSYLSPCLDRVFSTYVEMILHPFSWEGPYWSILHVCGDDPKVAQYPVQSGKYSPRMWRWSTKQLLLPLRTSSILHVCGDDPLITFFSRIVSWYSPRMWRWSWYKLQPAAARVVFSTYVEMILLFSSAWN